MTDLHYDSPACWTWPPPHADLIARVGLEADLLRHWQDGRCAACGILSDRLVEDHDHRTGFIRGYLCRSCNTREGKGGGALLALYRERNPATILGVEEVYINIYGRTPALRRDWTDEEFQEVSDLIDRVFGE